MASYQVLFSGDLVEGARKDAVQAKLARELGIDAQKSHALFSGRTVVLKSQLDEGDARRWQERMADLGAVCRIKDLDVNKASAALRYKDDETAHDHTLRDITAAHLECPRCSHLQLDSSHCARCGVDLAQAFKQKRKEDLIIEKKIKALRSASQTVPAARVPATASAAPVARPMQQAANDGPRAKTLGRMVGWLRRGNG